jgi:tetratricopeptide (TPR) repeat protein
VSKVAKDQSDHSLSNDLVERALFSFARASTSLFSTKISQGKARLDFARPENRELWLAGYHYIKSLTMKGTYRTALEWARLLLSLDPEDDPYCMRLVIHHLALRAHQFEWLIEASSSTVFEDYMPFIEDLELPSVALAHMHLKHAAESREVLGQSIKKLPYLFCQLFKELNLDDAPPSIWGILPRGNAEELYAAIYIRQTKDLWGTPEATALLVEVAHAVGKSDPDAIIGIGDSCIDLDAARFVYLDNTPALMSLVPSILLHRIPNSDSDPLPPEAEMNIFSHPTQRLPFATGATGISSDGGLEGFFDPIAALRQLVPGWTGPPPDEGPDAIPAMGLRELMERDMDREFGAVEAIEQGDNSGAEAMENFGSVRRLYRFLFGTRSVVPATELERDDREIREAQQRQRETELREPMVDIEESELSMSGEDSEFDDEEGDSELDQADEEHAGNTR